MLIKNIDIKLLQGIELNEIKGRVESAAGVFVRARVPKGRIGDLCYILSERDRVPARVVAIERGELVLMPYDEIQGTGVDSEVLLSECRNKIKIGSNMMGRVINGMGQPVDGRGKIGGKTVELDLHRKPPPPMKRRKIDSILPVGVKVIDGLLTVAEGQRMGIFAGAGVGKSTLLGMICRNAESDINVIALIGERGREVREFVEDILGEDGLKRSIVVVSTSDESPLMKIDAAYLATSIAEHFRDQGMRVILMMDSVTRFARALRDLGLASGEPPARQGFPPSVFATLPRLLERGGKGLEGSITAFYTVLMEGDDATEPVSDEVKSILDGHIILSREIACQGIYPAVDILESVSRVMAQVVTEEHSRLAIRFKSLLASYEAKRDIISVGMYRGGEKEVDFVIENFQKIRGFLSQSQSERVEFQRTLEELKGILDELRN